MDYSGEAGDIGYSVGVLRYGFLHGAAPAVEFYAGGSFNIASATLYYDKDSKNIWIDAGVDLEAAGYAVSAGMGYALPDVGTSEVQIVTVGISKEFEIASGVSMSPSLTYNYALGANTTANGGAGDQLVAGVNFTY